MTMHQVAPDVRVEDGPARKREAATKKLLADDVTASHYQEGQPDALGKPIKIGQQMDYLDWKGPRVWTVYRIEKESGRYMPVSVHATEEAALKAADKLVKSKGGA